MKKLAVVLLAIVCCVVLADSVYAVALQKGETVYVRSNLHVDGNTIFWHNMSIFRRIIPVGTPVKIEKSVGGRIVFNTPDSNKTYRVVADSKQWDKFFVKNKSEIGLDTVSPGKKGEIDKGKVSIGMTKQEVYASRGCPAYLAWGKTTEQSSFDSIMKSDKWYYMTNSRGHDLMVTFQNGNVVKIGGFEK